MPEIAKTVTAQIDPEWGPGNFCVDGEPFPWLISEGGPTATKLMDDLYLVRVEIFVVAAGWIEGPETFSHEGLGQTSSGWPQPVIMGREFPWMISEDGFTYRSSGRIVPTVELSFFAELVEGIPVEDGETPKDGKFRDARSYVIKRTEAA